MRSIIAVMISSIIIIAIPGNTANSQLDNELLGGGSTFVMFDKTKIDAVTTEAIIEDSGRRLKKTAAGEDGGMGSIEWWLRNSIPGNDVNAAMVEEPTQDNMNRDKRNAKFNIIGGDRSSDSDQFSTSTVATTTKYIDFDKLRWKWIATGGMKRGPCGYFSYIRCQ